MKPTEGSITIRWFAVGDPDPESGEYPDFDWKVDVNPPGLSDEEISNLLSEVAAGF